MKNLFESKNLVLLAAALVAGYLVWNTGKSVQKNYQLQQQVDQLEAEISVLELENENLKLNNEYYKTDAYLELEGRRKFNKVAAGESVLVFPKTDDSSDKQEDHQGQIEEKSNFGQWIDFLLGRQNS